MRGKTAILLRYMVVVPLLTNKTHPSERHNGQMLNQETITKPMT